MRFALTLIFSLLTVVPLAAHPGVGIVMDSRGNVFYTDLKHVWKIAPDGSKSIAVPNVHTHELYLDAEDNLYGEHLWYEGEGAATDRWGHYLWCLAPDGKLETAPPRQGFRPDTSFVRDRAGNMYWAERGSPTLIRKRAPDGTISTLGSADLQNVRWMACSPEGGVYLIDGDDLIRVARDGSVHTVARDLAERSIFQFFVGDQHAVMGLTPDAQGNVYVAVYAGRVVKKVTPEGQVSIVARSRPPWSPTGVLVAPNGDLWILEYSVTNAARGRRATVLWRARRLRPDGSSTTF